MKFKRLKIKNFGPIRELELFFEEDKCYHFVSENDSGKSMIIDAMKALCNNIADLHVKQYISDYSDSFYVEGEDFDGHIISLNRGSDSWYKLIYPNGTERFWDKLRGKVPEEVQNIVNIYKDNIKDEVFNFRYADDKILFMNTTPGENYSYFQKALGTDEVLKKLKKANSMENDLDKELDKIESKILYEKEKLNSTNDISHIKEEIEMYKKTVTDIMVKTKLLHEITMKLKHKEKLDKISIPEELVEHNWDDTNTELRKLSLMTKITDNMTELRNIVNKSNKINELNERHKEVTNIAETITIVNKIMSKHKIEQTIDKVLQKTEDLKEYTNKLQKVETDTKEAINKLSKIDNVMSMKRKEEIYDKLYNSNTSIQEDSILSNKLKSKRDLLKTTSNNFNELKEVVLKVNRKQEEVVELENKMKEFMHCNKFCPVVVTRSDRKCPFSNKGIEELVCGGDNLC